MKDDESTSDQSLEDAYSVYELLNEDEGMTAWRIANLTGIPRHRVDCALKMLEEEKMAARQTKRRGLPVTEWWELS